VLIANRFATAYQPALKAADRAALAAFHPYCVTSARCLDLSLSALSSLIFSHLLVVQEPPDDVALAIYGGIQLSVRLLASVADDDVGGQSALSRRVLAPAPTSVLISPRRRTGGYGFTRAW